MKTQFEPIIEAIRINSDQEFVINGELISASNLMLEGTEKNQPPLLIALQREIYSRAYTHGLNEPFPSNKPVQDNRNYLLSLSKANKSKDRWDNEWEAVENLPDGSVKVRKGNMQKHFQPGQFQFTDPSYQSNKNIRIHLSKESSTGQPGFYFAFGHGRERIPYPDDFIRIYWNITAEGAAPLLELITSELDQYDVPFRFKCCSYPEFFTRRDSAILYIKPPYYDFTFYLLAEKMGSLSSFLNDDVPPFTKKIGKGICICEDPNNGESFGMHHSRLIAQGIYDGYKQSLTSTNDILGIVNQYFISMGINPETPYLNPGSTDYFHHYFYQNQTTS